jgi:hypothetical protein
VTDFLLAPDHNGTVPPSNDNRKSDEMMEDPFDFHGCPAEGRNGFVPRPLYPQHVPKCVLS